MISPTESCGCPGCDVRCARVSELLPDDAAAAGAFASLPAWRRRKAEAFRFDADRRRSAAVWILLRQMLAERGLCADSLPVAENAFGKPSFNPSVGLRFNLSHACDRVMAAVSDAEIGCDVERIVPVDDGLAAASLASDELAKIAALPCPERDRAFFRLWVRKESYAKAVGRGMDIDPSSFSAMKTPPSPGWAWHDFDFGDGYLGCVCHADNCQGKI